VIQTRRELNRRVSDLTPNMATRPFALSWRAQLTLEGAGQLRDYNRAPNKQPTDRHRKTSLARHRNVVPKNDAATVPIVSWQPAGLRCNRISAGEDGETPCSDHARVFGQRFEGIQPD
jgi:hypothetical protein